MKGFTEKLSPTLSLKIGGATTKIPGGQVEAFDLKLHRWGCSGKIAFWTLDNTKAKGKDKDELLESFMKPDLIEVIFEVESSYASISESRPPDPIKINGIVRGRKLWESQHVKGEIQRRYEIEFADPAEVLWRLHKPCELYVDKTLKEMIGDHVGDKIEITYDWPVLEQNLPIIFVGLGATGNKADFYDLIIDLCGRKLGHWLYDAEKGTYKIAAENPAEGKAESFWRKATEIPEITFPEPPRWLVRVLNSNTDDIQKLEVTNENKAKEIRQDVLLWTPIAADVTDRKTLETSRQQNLDVHAKVDFSTWPVIDVRPGKQVKFYDKVWFTGRVLSDKTMRVLDLEISAETSDADVRERWGGATGQYNIRFKANFELSTEVIPRLPSWTPPSYPVLVEGKVFTEEGDEDELTWDAIDSPESIKQTRFEVPLWDDQKVVVDLHPNDFTGHFYFPPYRSQRALIAFYFTRAEIAHYIDWRPGAQQTQDSQGNALFMGMNEEDRTLITHDYQDDKPELLVERRNETDYGTIRIKEGTLTLRIEEKES